MSCVGPHPLTSTNLHEGSSDLTGAPPVVSRHGPLLAFHAQNGPNLSNRWTVPFAWIDGASIRERIRASPLSCPIRFRICWRAARILLHPQVAAGGRIGWWGHLGAWVEIPLTGTRIFLITLHFPGGFSVALPAWLPDLTTV